MPQVYINFINKDTFKEIRSVNLRSFDSFIETEIVTDSDKPETQAVLEHMDNIDHLREQRHGCYLLKLKDGGSMMLPPSEAETVIETLTRSYKK